MLVSATVLRPGQKLTQTETDSVHKKLLFFVTEDWYFVSHRLPLAIAAKNAGYNVGVVTHVRQCGQIIRDAGLTIIHFEISRSGMNPLRELLSLARLMVIFFRERPHVAHNVAMKPVLYGGIAARLVGVPQVVNAIAGMGWLFTSNAGLARWLNPLVRRWLRWALGKTGIALVQNADDAQLLLRLRVPASRIRVIAGSGVDLEKFHVMPESVTTPVVLFPSRLLWDKGIAEFVAAARTIKQRGVCARFVVAGAPDRSNPSSVSYGDIASWVNAETVEYIGWVVDMPKCLAESHIVCLPSYREGLPKSLIEAAAAGRPIITTDTPGCREVVRHGDNGLLVPCRNVEKLVDALMQLIGDPVMRQTMGARGRARAEQEFGLKTIVDQTLALYAETPR